MNSFSIGLSGLNAAQQALDIIGNNIANAANEDYHRQRIDLTPAYSSQLGAVTMGGGVEVKAVTRVINNLLEQEILRQQSSLSQLDSELATLQTVESAFGELSSDGGLSLAMDEFFNALQDLATHPSSIIWQSQATTAAESMAFQFRTLVDFLNNLRNQISTEADYVIDEINTLTGQIAELNDNIERIQMIGGSANNLSDQRDGLIAQLAGLVDVQTQQRGSGAVDVSAAGIPVVTGTDSLQLDLGRTPDGTLGISVVDAYLYSASAQGGELGALMSVTNGALVDIQSSLDDLAKAIITQINQNHVQAVSSQGAFTQLTGWHVASENLVDFDPPITDGKIYIRVTDTATETVTRYEIDIDASNDSLTTIADYITNNIAGLSASVGSSRLSIYADSTYKFDFLPAVLSDPVAETLTGTTPPSISISGICMGSDNDTLRFTISGAGTVGNGNLQLEVKDSAGTGDVIATLNIGVGYAAGDLLELGNGISISVGTGDFGNGDNFDVQVLANTDTSGVLAAAGINAFFTGTGADDIAVSDYIANSPASIAVALGADMTDNENALRLAAVKDQATGTLNSLTAGEFYLKVVTDIAQQLSIKRMQQENVETITRNLVDQRSDISGVDMNEEAARMLIFEQMFQAMAKYISTVNASLATLMEII